MPKKPFFSAVLVISMLASMASADLLPPRKILPGILCEIRLTALRQNLLEEEVRPDVYLSTVERVRITNRDLLQILVDEKNLLLPPAEKIGIPPQTRFWIDPSRKYLVAIDGNGKVFGSIPFEVTTSASFGQNTIINPLYASENFLSRAQAKLNHSAMAFLLHGLLTEQVQRVNGLVYSKYTARLAPLTGAGNINETNFLFTGSIQGQRPLTEIPLALQMWKPPA